MRVCVCVNVRARVGARMYVRLWVRARASALEAAHVFVYACASDILMRRSVCVWVAGVRTCMYVCEHSNVYVYVCAGACAYA